jgi:hypothetical protein
MAFGRSCDGLAIGDARRMRRDFELVVAGHALEKTAHLQFAKAA